MPTVNPKCTHLSASSIASFKACPMRYRLAYREGLRLEKDTDSQRVGTNWHKCHEVYANALKEASGAESCRTGTAVTDYAMQQVMAHLDEAYAHCPAYIEPKAWALEKVILITCFVGYQWYWSQDPIEFLASEVPFDLPIHLPRTGLPLPMDEVKRVGKIDHVIRWHGAVGALERKSTSRAIDPDSDYWDKAKKDTQVSMYALAMQDMAHADIGKLKLWSEGRYGSTLYDVWHKPTIKPAMLTQKETAEFIETGMYCEEQFTVIDSVDSSEQPTVTVDGEVCEIEVGKKDFAIRETTRMFSARLLVDIQARPEFYFQRREIARTDAELKRFRADLYAIYSAMKVFEKDDLWYENESQCRATYACSYIPICYGVGADAVCDGKTIPASFKRIFVDLTIHGQAVEEE